MLLQNPYFVYPTAPPPLPPFSIVQKNGGAVYSSNGAYTFLYSFVTSGNSVIAAVLFPDSNTTTINASAAVSGTPIPINGVLHVQQNTGNAVGYFYATNVPFGSFTLNVTPTSSTKFVIYELYEVTPLKSSSPVLTTKYINTTFGTTSPLVTDISTSTLAVPSFVLTSMMDNGGTTNMTTSLPSQWSIDQSSLSGSLYGVEGVIASSIVPATSPVDAVWTVSNGVNGANELYSTVAFAI